MGLCGTRTGSHSSLKEFRHSELKVMGDGVSLYFKMLGCLTWLFFILGILQLPSVIISYSGVANKFKITGKDEWQKWIAYTTTGNQGPVFSTECSKTLLPLNSAGSTFKFQCTNPNHALKSLELVGLSDPEEVCGAITSDTKVNTLGKCTTGSAGVSDENLQEMFGKYCLS